MDYSTKICLLVCVFAAVREFRPIEPFFTEFLVGPDVGFSEKQAVQDILVIWAYSSTVLVIVVFLITDYLRYKPIIIADGVAGIMAYALLLGKPSVTTMQIEQIFFSFFYASNTAYYTYMYAKIEDKTTYNKITGLVRASVLFGMFLSGCMSQIFVLLGGDSKLPLVYMSIGGMCTATLLSLFFPPVKHSVYFHRKTEADHLTTETGSAFGVSTTQIFMTDDSAGPNPVKTEEFPKALKTCRKLKSAKIIKYLWTDFKSAFTNQKVVVWAFWWMVAGAGSNMVTSYCQVVWKEVIDENYDGMKSYNGVVDCIYTGLSAAASYKVGTLDWDWSKHSNTFLTIGSVGVGVLIMLTSHLNNLWLLYLCHVLFGLVYNTMLTVAEFEIAKQLKESCYGLVFGFIQFMAIFFTSIWTAVVVEDTFFSFNIRRQFEFCSVYFIAIGIYYLFGTLRNLCCGTESKKL